MLIMHLLRAGELQRSHIQVILMHWPRLVNPPLALLACTAAPASLPGVLLRTVQTAVNVQDDVIVGIGRGRGDGGAVEKFKSYQQRTRGCVCVGQVQE